MSGLSLAQIAQLVAGVWLFVNVLKMVRFGWRPVRIELPLAAVMFVFAVVAGRWG